MSEPEERAAREPAGRLRRSLLIPGIVGIVGLSLSFTVMLSVELGSREVDLDLRRRLAAGALLLGGLTVVAHLLWMGEVGRRLATRARRIGQHARRLAAGTVLSPIEDPIGDEMSDASDALDAVSSDAAERLGRLDGLALRLEAVTGQVRKLVEATRADGAARCNDIKAAASISADLTTALAELTARAEQVRETANSSAMTATRAALVAEGGARGLAVAEETAAASATHSTAIARAIAEVVARTEEVSRASATSLTTLRDLNSTTQRVRETAEAAVRLAHSAGSDAERGQAAVVETLGGIDRIREASRAISEVTVGLETRAREIGAVLQLVGDLTERTNLLALNASIIAARAGVEGRGFAVVAAEIKSLAQRTATSAGEIARLVRRVEEDANEARRAAEAGSLLVEAGSTRVRATATVLSDIFVRVREGAQLSASIATATDEQQRASRYLADAMSLIAGAVEQITRITTEQGRQGEQLALAAGRLRDLIRSAADAAREQRDGNRMAVASTDMVANTVEQVVAAQRGRSGEAGRLRSALSAATASADRGQRTLGDLEALLGELHEQIRDLVLAVQRPGQ